MGDVKNKREENRNKNKVMSGDCSMEGLQIVVQRSVFLYLWPEAESFSFFPSLSGSHFKILSFVGNIDLKKKKKII